MQKYFVCNWEKFNFTRDWKLTKNIDTGHYKEGKILEIDLLAQNKKNKKHWLVIELKLRRAKDKELHQVLRYMRWIREEKLSGEEGNVNGWIIAGRPLNNSLSLLIKKDHPDLKYFIFSFDKNKKLCLKDT